MGTEYDEFRKPCPCGNGTIRVGCSSPDHPWVSTYSVHWDADIECTACQQTYTIEGRDTDMRVVRRSEAEAVAGRRKAYDAACEQFMASPAIDALRGEFARHLDGMRSVAAIHRYLEANSMAGYAITAFRKNWKGGTDWASRHIFVGTVAKIAGLLGQSTAIDRSALEELKKMEAAIGRVPTVMGGITQRSI